MNRRVLLAVLVIAALVVCARLVWRAGIEPDDALQRAQSALEAGALDEAGRLARAALVVRPLDGRAYRVLAQVAARRGDQDQIATYTALAVRYAPRDVQARAMAAQLAIEAGDFATAVDHYDRMLRVEPESAQRVFPVMMALAQTDAGRERLLARLAEKPLWRPALLQQLAHALPGAADLPPLFHELGRRTALAPAELAAYIGRFVDDRQWPSAYLAWLNELRPPLPGQLTSPVNGDFELPVAGGSPFEWHIDSLPAIEARIVSRDDGPGRALRVVFTGARSPFQGVRQLLLLQPGLEYRLRWRNRLDALDTPRGLHWVVSCADGPSGTLLSGQLLRGSGTWERHEQAFRVPAGCPAQWLQLELEARIPAETYARGTAWFDDVDILAGFVAGH